MSDIYAENHQNDPGDGMTEPCHCDLTTENAKLRAEVERLKREATSARSAIRHAIQLIEGPGGNRKECLADLRAVLAYEPRAALNPAPEVKP